MLECQDQVSSNYKDVARARLPWAYIEGLQIDHLSQVTHVFVATLLCRSAHGLLRTSSYKNAQCRQ